MKKKRNPGKEKSIMDINDITTLLVKRLETHDKLYGENRLIDVEDHFQRWIPRLWQRYEKINLNELDGVVGLQIDIKEHRFTTKQTSYILDLVNRAIKIGGMKERELLIPKFKLLLKFLSSVAYEPKTIKTMINSELKKWGD